MTFKKFIIHKFSTLLLGTFLLTHTKAQLHIGTSNDLYVSTGESISFGDVTFTPSAGYSFPATTLTRTDAWSITPAPFTPYLKKYYSFSNTITGFAGKVEIDHADASPKVGANNEPLSNTADLRLNVRTNGTTWTVPTADQSTSTKVIGNLNGDINTMAVASVNTPLPVSWLSFSGKLNSNGVLLQWVTASELNSSHFDVERSGNGTNFAKISSVQAAGHSTTKKAYEYLDATPLPKQSWYRLKQVDLDGKYSYSSILPISRDAKISSYPNPISNQLQLQLSQDWKGSYDMVVFDLTGKMVMKTSIKAGSYMFDCSKWANGVYNVVIYQDNQQVYEQRLVKQ